MFSIPRFARVLILLLFALAPVSTNAQSMPTLARFEDPAAMPQVIADLPFAAGRAYAILAMIPAPATVSLAEPNSLRRGVLAFLNPVATARAGTQIGHAMVGWRCTDGTQGLVGKTSDDPDMGLQLLRGGWGMAALLSEYRFGRLVSVADIPEEHHRALRGPRVRITAFEIDEAGCQSMRRALVSYLAHPGQPERRYTNQPDPARMQGDGCASFALWLVGRAGVFDSARSSMHRSVVLRDSFMGQGEAVPEGVIPLRVGTPGHHVGLRDLLFGDWNAGTEVARMTLLDPELMLAALDRAYARGGIARDSRLAPGDPAAAPLRSAADGWLARYGRVTPLRHGQARAVVLHRR